MLWSIYFVASVLQLLLSIEVLIQFKAYECRDLPEQDFFLFQSVLASIFPVVHFFIFLFQEFLHDIIVIFHIVFFLIFHRLGLFILEGIDQ